MILMSLSNILLAYLRTLNTFCSDDGNSNSEVEGYIVRKVFNASM